MQFKVVKMETVFDWVRIPTDLPRKNLVMIVAKTIASTYHPEDKDGYVQRVFNPKEMYEAARSLAQRPMGLNHFRDPIPGAYTIDANWNQEQQQIEALCFLPDQWINWVRAKLSRNEAVNFSVEYTWRDEVETPRGIEFQGFVFNRVDIVDGLTPGDVFTAVKLVESRGRSGLMEGQLSQDMISDSIANEPDPFGQVKKEAEEAMKTLGEPFAGYRDFADCVARNKDKSNPDAYCGYIKHQAEPKKKEEASVLSMIPGAEIREANLTGKKQVPEIPENTMANEPTPMSAIHQPEVRTPGTVSPLVGSTGLVDEKGAALGVAVDLTGNPHKNLDAEPAKATESEDKGTPIHGSDVTEVNVVSQDNSKQKVESTTAKPDEKKPEEKKKVEEIKPVEKSVAEKLVETPAPVIIPPVQPAVVEKPVETKPVATAPVIPDPKDIRIKELDEAVQRLQANATKIESDKAKAIKEAEKKIKKELVQKIEEILPPGSLLTNWNRGGQKLAENIRKLMYEEREQQ